MCWRRIRPHCTRTFSIGSHQALHTQNTNKCCQIPWQHTKLMSTSMTVQLIGKNVEESEAAYGMQNDSTADSVKSALKHALAMRDKSNKTLTSLLSCWGEMKEWTESVQRRASPGLCAAFKLTLKVNHIRVKEKEIDGWIDEHQSDYTSESGHQLNKWKWIPPHPSPFTTMSMTWS